MSNAPLLECRDVVKHYRRGEELVRAVEGVSFTVERGGALCITGRSGSGKTTLLNCVGALDRVTSGEILLAGNPIGKLTGERLLRLRREWLGFVFQESHLLPHLSSLDNTALPLVYRGASWKEARREAAPLLEQFGLSGRSEQPARLLSGGEAQRVAIARSIIYRPKILLADEPTAELDTATAKEILRLLMRQKENGTTLILTTHDPLVEREADQTLRLEDGRLT